MIRIGLDLGYGFTKGVNEKGNKVVFRSVVSSGTERNGQELFGNNSASLHDLHVKVNGEHFFVGELAEKEGVNATFTLENNKINHPNTILLLTSAVGLLMDTDDETIHLATGLPYSTYFSPQRAELERVFANVNKEISFEGGPKKGQKKRIRIEKITTFPQCAAAAYRILLTPELQRQYKTQLQCGQMVAFIDIGFYSTDFVVFEVNADSVDLRPDLSGTINRGVSTVYPFISKEFIKRTGGDFISNTDVEKLIRNKQIYWREMLDFSGEINKQLSHLTQQIQDHVRMYWGTRSNQVSLSFLIGGGGELLRPFFNNLPGGIELVPNAQLANAEGFLLVAQQKDTISTPPTNQRQEQPQHTVQPQDPAQPVQQTQVYGQSPESNDSQGPANTATSNTTTRLVFNR